MQKSSFVRLFLAFAVILSLCQCATSSLQLPSASRSPEGAPLPYAHWSSFQPGTAGAQARYGSSPTERKRYPMAQIDVPKGSAVAFYQYNRDMQGVVAGEIYEMTARVKTENVTEGVGAYLALSALGAPGTPAAASAGATTSTSVATPPPAREPLASGESERVTKTTDWTLVRCVLYIPDKVDTVRALLLLHGTGRAFFDDVRLRRIQTTVGAADIAKRGGAPVQMTVTDHVTTPYFLGFGVEDDCFFYTDENTRHGVNDEDIALRNRRIEELDPKVIGTIFWWNSICPTHNLDTIDYNTDLFAAFVKTLAVHQTAGRTVFLGDAFWSWTPEEFAYGEKNVEKGAAAYADLIVYLVKNMGLSCIRYISVTGEVDTTFESLGGTFDSYSRAVELLRSRLDAAGLRDVQIVGDKSGGFVWFRNAIAKNDAKYGLFTIHEYLEPSQYPILSDRLDRTLEAIRQNSKPIGKTNEGGAICKPIFLYEIGVIKQARLPNEQMGSLSPTYEYGLYCAYAAIQAMNRGFAGGSVWCLHSMYYPFQNLMDFGLWDYNTNNWQLRPNYYATGMLTKFTSPDMRPVQVLLEPKIRDFAVAALVDKNGAYCFYAVNLSNTSIALKVAGIPDGLYAFYAYEKDKIPKKDEPKYGRIDSLRTGEMWRCPDDDPIVIPAQSLILLRNQSQLLKNL